MCRQRTEKVVHSILHKEIYDKKEKSEEKDSRDDHKGRSNCFPAARPRYVIKLFSRILEEFHDTAKLIPQLAEKIIHGLNSAYAQTAASEIAAGVARLKWQARRDSNPQQTVLETAALPLELLACANLTP
jgi:hypothetical protein